MKAASCAAILCLAFAAAAPAEGGTRYSRGSIICNDFEDMEESYKREPESVNLQIGYGMCLIAKGHDFEGLKFLQDAARVDNNVKAAFELARYMESQGTSDPNNYDDHDLDKIIDACFKVLFYIDLTPNYPRGRSGFEYVLYETSSQM